MFKTIAIIILSLLEIPFFVKFLKAHRNFEIIRETAIVIIMLIIAGIIFLLTKL